MLCPLFLFRFGFFSITFYISLSLLNLIGCNVQEDGQENVECDVTLLVFTGRCGWQPCVLDRMEFSHKLLVECWCCDLLAIVTPPHSHDSEMDDSQLPKRTIHEDMSGVKAGVESTHIDYTCDV